MTQRRFIEESGGSYPTVTYEATYDNGAKQICVCHKTEWEVYVVMEKLLNSGADEVLVRQLRTAAYDLGRQDEFEDHVDESW